MHGLRNLAPALARLGTVAALTISSMLMVITPGSRTAAAYNGGTAFDAPAAQPCVAPCFFDGNNEGVGLSSYPTPFANYAVTWWSFTPTQSLTYTFRAHSSSPASWDNTLVLTEVDGTIVTSNNDKYQSDAMISPLLAAGTAYRFGLGSFTGETGTARITISASTPDAPTGLTGVGGDHTVALSWTAPSDNLAAITSYRIYRSGSAGYTTVAGAPPITSRTITGLTNGDIYTFQVSAVNANGEGLKSTAIDAMPVGATTTSIGFSVASPTYGDTFSVLVTVSGSSLVDDGVVTLSVDGTPVGESQDVIDGTATFTGQSGSAGSHTYTATFAESNGWLPSTAAPSSITIGKATQTITFTQPPDTAYATRTVVVSPTATSSGVVTVTSSPTSVCTVSSFTVTLVTGGTCTLTAEQAGTANHLAATSVERSFAVTAAPQTVAFPRPADRTWSGAAFELAPSASTGLTVTLASDTTAVCTVTGFTVTMVRTGTCTLTARQAGSTHFAAASQQRSFDITGVGQGALLAGADSYALTVGGTTNVASSGGSGSGVVTFAVTSGADRCSLTGSVLTAIATGTCVVTATKAGDGVYAPATDDTATITVSKIVPTAAITGNATVQSGNSTTVAVTVTGLRPGYAPGQVTPQLSGAAGALVTPAAATLELAGDGRSGSATFTVTTGAAGTVQVGASVAATSAYEPADAPEPAVVSVTPVPAALIPTVPSRIIDTRPDHPHMRPSPDRLLAAGEVLEVQFTDLPGLVPPSNVSAVALNIGVVAPQGDGYVTSYPCGDRPVVSSLNYRRGQTVSNAAIVPVDELTGSVCFYSSQAAYLIVDVDGWFAVGNGFVAVSPRRLVDTRPGHEAVDTLTGPFAAGEAREVTVTGIDGLVPASGVAAVSLNLTVVNPTAAGFVSAYACGERPNASNVNFSAGRTVANLAIVPVDPDTGSVCFYASQSLHLVVDINGWFEVGQGFDAAGPARVFDSRPGYSGLRTVASERVGGSAMLTVQLTDLEGLVPADGVGAVSLNVTAIDPANDGFVTVWACGARPDASSVNYAAHRTTASAVIAPVDPATGTVCFYSSQPAHFAVDVNGWFIGNAVG